MGQLTNKIKGIDKIKLTNLVKNKINNDHLNWLTTELDIEGIVMKNTFNTTRIHKMHENKWNCMNGDNKRTYDYHESIGHDTSYQDLTKKNEKIVFVKTT